MYFVATVAHIKFINNLVYILLHVKEKYFLPLIEERGHYMIVVGQVVTAQSARWVRANVLLVDIEYFRVMITQRGGAINIVANENSNNDIITFMVIGCWVINVCVWFWECVCVLCSNLACPTCCIYGYLFFVYN